MDKLTKKQMTRELVEIVSHPAFEELLQELDNLPQEKKQAYAEKAFTIKNMTKQGVPVTKDFRITLRNFEGDKISTKFDKLSGQQVSVAGGTTVCASVGYIGCISVGKAL